MFAYADVQASNSIFRCRVRAWALQNGTRLPCFKSVAEEVFRVYTINHTDDKFERQLESLDIN